MIMNALIIMLFVLNLFLWMTKKAPVLMQMSQWSLVVLFTIHWAIGGYLAYPFLANVAVTFMRGNSWDEKCPHHFIKKGLSSDVDNYCVVKNKIEEMMTC